MKTYQTLSFKSRIQFFFACNVKNKLKNLVKTQEKELTQPLRKCCSLTNFLDSRLNDGSLARRKAINYETDGFQKSAQIDLGPPLISSFIANDKIMATNNERVISFCEKYLVENLARND